jgi:predicted RNA-binding Zn-ribbon protein involved in translation (DUF1610 family)
MPKCPRCGKEIDSITNIQSGYMEYVLKVDENGDHDYTTPELPFTPDDSLNDFCCPECNLSLFPDDEENAVAFLRGEIEARYDEKEDRVVIEKRNEIA